MKNKNKIPWYKKIFHKHRTKEEYIGYTTIYSRFIWSKEKTYFEAPVYRQFDERTNETLSIYADAGTYRKLYFSVDAYEKQDKLIALRS